MPVRSRRRPVTSQCSGSAGAAGPPGAPGADGDAPPDARSDADVITVLESGHASRARRARAAHRSAGVVTTVVVAAPVPCLTAAGEHATTETRTVPSLNEVFADMH